MVARSATAAGAMVSGAPVVPVLHVREGGDVAAAIGRLDREVVLSLRRSDPVTVNVCCVPGAAGMGSPVAWLAEAQLASSIAAVEYRTSYEAAWPLSSVGAVQRSEADPAVVPVTARSAIAAGGVVSGGAADQVEPVAHAAGSPRATKEMDKTPAEETVTGTVLQVSPKGSWIVRAVSSAVVVAIQADADLRAVVDRVRGIDVRL